MRDIVAEQRSKIYNSLKAFMERDDKESFQHKLRHHSGLNVKDILVTGSGMFILLENDAYFKIPFGVTGEIVSIDRCEN